jgi:Ca-activated chloride channel family protein
VVTDGALPPQPVRDVAVPVEWVQIGSAVPNRAIIAFASRPWGGRIQVYARVASYDTAPFNGTLRIVSGNQVLAEEQVTIAPNGETEISWTLPGGVETLRAVIDGRDAAAAGRLRLSERGTGASNHGDPGIEPTGGSPPRS